MTWTKAETAVLAKIVAALIASGMVDSTSSVADPSKCIFSRDFLDNKTLQKGKQFCVYSPKHESWSQSADNAKIDRSVGVSITLATTKSPKIEAVISLRETMEEKLEQNGFRVRFIQSGFDDETKLYVFQYEASTEVTDG